MAEPTLLPGKESSYKQMPVRATYVLGVHALQRACERDHSTVHPQFTLDDGSQIYRPLTFRENIEARVQDYETLHTLHGRKRTLQERLRLFNHWQDSCTGIATKAESTKFKIIPICKELITIPKDFEGGYVSTPYRKLEPAELDIKKGRYRQPLTKAQVLELPGWQAAVEHDTSLLSAFTAIIFAELKRLYQRDTGMGFYVEQNTKEDKLRALLVYYLGGYSGAGGDYDLNDRGSFLRGSPVVGAPARRTQPHPTVLEEQLLEKLRPYLKPGTEQKAGRTIRNFLK